MQFTIDNHVISDLVGRIKYKWLEDASINCQTSVHTYDCVLIFKYDIRLTVCFIFFFFFFILFPILGGGRCTITCSMVVHIIRRQSLLFDIILYFVQSSSLRPSSLPSPLYFHYNRTPSYIVFLSSDHMPIPLQPPLQCASSYAYID